MKEPKNISVKNDKMFVLLGFVISFSIAFNLIFMMTLKILDTFSFGRWFFLYVVSVVVVTMMTTLGKIEKKQSSFALGYSLGLGVFISVLLLLFLGKHLHA